MLKRAGEKRKEVWTRLRAPFEVSSETTSWTPRTTADSSVLHIRLLCELLFERKLTQFKKKNLEDCFTWCFPIFLPVLEFNDQDHFWVLILGIWRMVDKSVKSRRRNCFCPRDTNFGFPYAKCDVMADIEVGLLQYIEAGQNSGRERGQSST